LYVNLFVAGAADVDVADGKVKIEQETTYPWDGRVTIKLTPQSAGQRIALNVRIPGWARGEAFVSDLYSFADASDAHFALTVNGQPFAGDVEYGYVTIDRKWKAGDMVTLELPMPIRRVVANEKVEADRGRVALMRGPVVYCIEWPDVPGGKVSNLVLPDDNSLDSEFRKDLLGGVQVVTGAARRDGQTDEITFTAIPYYAWANRGPGEMAVWLQRSPQSVK
jgi:hypothetical protein